MIKGALLFVLFSATCARLSCILSFRVHVKPSIVSYRIVMSSSCIVIEIGKGSAWMCDIEVEAISNQQAPSSILTYLLTYELRLLGRHLDL